LDASPPLATMKTLILLIVTLTAVVFANCASDRERRSPFVNQARKEVKVPGRQDGGIGQQRYGNQQGFQNGRGPNQHRPAGGQNKPLLPPKNNNKNKNQPRNQVRGSFGYLTD